MAGCAFVRPLFVVLLFVFIVFGCLNTTCSVKRWQGNKGKQPENGQKCPYFAFSRFYGVTLPPNGQTRHSGQIRGCIGLAVFPCWALAILCWIMPDCHPLLGLLAAGGCFMPWVA